MKVLGIDPGSAIVGYAILEKKKVQKYINWLWLYLYR